MNKEINNLINEFAMYMNSEKFHCGCNLDGFINVSDVHDMLDQIRDINITN